MDLTNRDVVPAGAAGIVAILNPIIESRLYTVVEQVFDQR